VSDGDESKPTADAQPAAEENRRARRAAQSKQRSERDRERREAAATGLDAGERVDDAFSRFADSSFRWLKEHFNLLQWVIVAAVALWIGSQIYTWRTEKAAGKISDTLALAIAAEQGKIGAADQEGKRDSRGEIDVRRAFATDADRLKAAEDEFRKIAAGSGISANLGKLGLAGVLYDQGRYDDAQKLYSEVLGTELAKLDPDARARSLEGVGLSLEAKGDKEGALKKFSELENADVAGFRELALYHQARVLHAKGDDAAAKDKLLKVTEKLAKESSSPTDAPSYLFHAARDLLERIDPSSVPKPSSDEALQKALQEFQKNLPPGAKGIQSLPLRNGVPVLPQ
jgi:tetratricopeptide (TPR) repeat protein